MEKFKGTILAIISASLFGFMPIFATFAYEGGLNSFTLVFLRYFFATLMLLGFILIKRFRLKKKGMSLEKLSLKLSRKQFLTVIPVSILGYILTTIMLFSSYNYIDVGLATVLHFTFPTVIIIASIVIFKEKVHIGKILSLLLSIFGITLLLGKDLGISLNVLGVFLALISGIFYAYYLMSVSKSCLNTLNNYVMTFYLSAVGSIALLIIGLFTNQLIFNVEAYSYILAITMALINSVFAVIALQLSVRLIGPSTASILSTFEPIVGVILGILILNEPFTVRSMLGGSLIILSVVILTFFERSKDINVKI